MKDPLFKPSTASITPEEDAEITRSLAAAYLAHEESERKPALQRIAKLVQEKLDQQEAQSSPSDAESQQC